MGNAFYYVILAILFVIVIIESTVLYSSYRKKKKLGGNYDFLRDSDDLYERAKFSELGIMSAGIAHEINNPVAVIQAKASQLLRCSKNPKQKVDMTEGLEQIMAMTERIAKIVHGIREFIYQDNQNYEDEIHIEEIFESLQSFCGQRLKNHGIELRIKYAEGVKISGNRVQLELAFLNLINNSLDAIDDLPEKWIEIKVRSRIKDVQIFFTDSGYGIPEEQTNNIMKPFYTTKKLKGTGLGLPLVKGIIEKHEGTFTYMKEERHTTFKIELPTSLAIQREIGNSFISTQPSF